MYLIDSSLWIDYFRPKGSSAIKHRVRQILQEDQALICGIIIVEVLRGARNENEYSVLRDSLTSLPQIPFDDEIFERAAHWGFHWIESVRSHPQQIFSLLQLRTKRRLSCTTMQIMK